jgi:uncharacterized membrane protein YdjX (TVP38/TMEM64 family)
MALTSRQRAPAVGGMHRYWLLAATIAATLLVVFIVVQALGVPLLSDPRSSLDEAGPPAAALGVGLLVADVALPVPSSVVMTAHGTLFGVVLGSLLSLLGSTGAAAAAFAIGRRGGPLLHKLLPADERERADALLVRSGALAIVLTRPLPLLAETTALAAGASPLAWRPAMAAAVAGSIPAAVLYALAGAAAASFASTTVVFAAVIVVAAIFWLISHRFAQPPERDDPTKAQKAR